MPPTDEHRDGLKDAITHLQNSYIEYMASLKRVLDFGVDNIPPLVAALDHKHANPIAKALGLMMHSPEVGQAIPRLLDWLVVQSPLYPDVLEALVRAGDKSLPLLAQRIADYAARGDDEAVRNLLDLGWRLPDKALPQIVSIVTGLLGSENAGIREAAADAIWRIGLPHARVAEPQLREVASGDEVESVRNAVEEAIARIALAP